MNLRLDRHGTAAIYAGVLLVVGAGLQMAYNLTLPLYGDEAYYWVWSKKLQLGYFDHPPMVAYINALFCAVFGDTLVAIRLATVCCLSLAALFIYLLSVKVFEPRTALFALVLFLLSPAAHLGFSIHTIDSPLTLFWSMALYYGYKAVCDNHWQDYLLTGVGLGAALLSKYTAVLFVGFFGCFLLLKQPRMLLQANVWLALSVALLIFSPVLVYNAQHGFASFTYQYAHGSAAAFTVRLDAFGDFFLGQFVVLSPIFMGLLIVAGYKYRFWWEDTRRTYLMLSFLVPMGFFLYKALFKRLELNWGVVAFLGALPVLAHFILTYRLKRLAIAGMILALSLDMAMRFPLLFGLTDAWNYHHWIFGYQEMALQVLAHKSPDDLLFADRHPRASILWFYARTRVYIPIPVRFSEYSLWDAGIDFGKLRGIYVSMQDQESMLRTIFPEVHLLERFTVRKAGYLPKVFFIYRVGSGV